MASAMPRLSSPWSRLLLVERVLDQPPGCARRRGDTMAHLGTRAFDSISGDVVSTTAFVLRNSTGNSAGDYIRLTDLPPGDKAAELRRVAGGEPSTRRFAAASSDFALIPDSPIAYDFSDDVRRLYRANRSLGERVSLKQGMATTDNARFVRFWHEVSLRRLLAAAPRLSRSRRARDLGFPTTRAAPRRVGTAIRTGLCVGRMAPLNSPQSARDPYSRTGSSSSPQFRGRTSEPAVRSSAYIRRASF